MLNPLDQLEAIGSVVSGSQRQKLIQGQPEAVDICTDVVAPRKRSGAM